MVSCKFIALQHPRVTSMSTIHDEWVVRCVKCGRKVQILKLTRTTRRLHQSEEEEEIVSQIR